ncbi:MAG: hypothetical protein HYS51_00850 [Candidatus Zambryskibacteria bacterium]|nr:hypothetical protein [Candidatus Zambryskibacteria bacterium]
MPTTLQAVIRIFIDLIKLLFPVLVGMALLVFLWGLAKFIFRVGGDEKAVTEGQQLMKWGIIALFVMVSFWGILAMIYSDIGFGRPFGLPLLPQ